MSRWFRHYAGMMRDDKLVRVAIRSKQTIERVVWVWGAILESAAEIDDGGRYDLDVDEAAYFLRADVSELHSIVGALEAVGRVSEGSVGKWSDRQYQSDRRGGTSRGSEAYVYCVGSTWDATVKIGFSRNPWARAKELQTGNSAKVEVLAHFRTTGNSEVDLHNLLGEHRHAGEWFNLPDKVAKLVQDAATESKTYEELVELLRRSLRSATSSGPETETELETEEEKPKAKALVKKRCAIPDDWQPVEFTTDSESRKVVDSWPPGEKPAQVEQFKAHHRSKRNTFVDPQDAWSTWVLNTRKWGIGRNERSSQASLSSVVHRILGNGGTDDRTGEDAGLGSANVDERGTARALATRGG